MSKLSGLGMEAEEIGMVAMIGLLLVPGLMWVAKAKSGPSMVLRGVVVGAVIGGAALLEASMDQSANKLTE